MDETTESTTAILMANRIYIYRLLHIVYGATPSEDELKVLSSDDSVDAFEALSNADDDAMAAASRMCGDLKAKLGDTEFLDALKTVYDKVLVIPGSCYVHPWESPYIGKETMVFQESTLDVRKRYAEFGFQAQEYKHFPEDHIAMMCDFMGNLSERAFEDYQAGEDRKLDMVLSAQQSFIAEHMTEWIPKFVGELEMKDESGLYFGFGKALQTFLEIDQKFIESVIG